MVIFHSYVSLPEGKSGLNPLFPVDFSPSPTLFVSSTNPGSISKRLASTALHLTKTAAAGDSSKILASSAGETLTPTMTQLLLLGGHPASFFGRDTWVRVLNWMKVRSTGKGP